jgi:cytochrome d ubiquinol oxidase subunit I
MEDMILYNRLQFAFTITFHYLFPQLTMGLSLMIVYFKWKFLQTQNEDYNHASKFWMKIFALNFTMGVVTGIPMEFHLVPTGLNFLNLRVVLSDRP